MIVSTQGKVIFFHNPKVAGASVHASLSRFHDGHVNGWGVGEGNRLLAHDGIDEFAEKNPVEWARIKSWKMYALYRDRYERFMSSFSQYSRSFGDIDTRFASPEKSRDYLFTMIDTLASYGKAEAILGQDQFILFRPQWIYLHSEDHDVDLTCFHISEIDQLFTAIEERVGEPIERKRINEREQLDLPGPLAAILSQGHFAAASGNCLARMAPNAGLNSGSRRPNPLPV